MEAHWALLSRVPPWLLTELDLEVSPSRHHSSKLLQRPWFSVLVALPQPSSPAAQTLRALFNVFIHRLHTPPG